MTNFSASKDVGTPSTGQHLLRKLVETSTEFSQVVLQKKRASTRMTGGLASASGAVEYTFCYTGFVKSPHTHLFTVKHDIGFVCCFDSLSLQADRLQHEIGHSTSSLAARSDQGRPCGAIFVDKAEAREAFQLSGLGALGLGYFHVSVSVWPRLQHI